MKTILAKFKSKCAETGKTIEKGDPCLYDPAEKKVYCEKSQEYIDFMYEAHKAMREKEQKALSQFIEDQENAAFDDFCCRNNI